MPYPLPKKWVDYRLMDYSEALYHSSFHALQLLALVTLGDEGRICNQEKGVSLRALFVSVSFM